MTSLYFKYAAMNSGKSTQLLQAHYNYIERGMHPLAMTAQIDSRHGEGKITARIGIDLPAHTFSKGTDIFAFIREQAKKRPVAALLIDEAQFLSEEQVFQCARVVDELNVPVLAYGLKTDFLGKLFAGSEALLRLADNIEEIKAICWCGRKATHTARVSDGKVVRAGAQVAIGGNDMYTSLCRKHFVSGETGVLAKKAERAA